MTPAGRLRHARTSRGPTQRKPRRSNAIGRRARQQRRDRRALAALPGQQRSLEREHGARDDHARARCACNQAHRVIGLAHAAQHAHREGERARGTVGVEDGCSERGANQRRYATARGGTLEGEPRARRQEPAVLRIERRTEQGQRERIDLRLEDGRREQRAHGAAVVPATQVQQGTQPRHGASPLLADPPRRPLRGRQVESTQGQHGGGQGAGARRLGAHVRGHALGGQVGKAMPPVVGGHARRIEGLDQRIGVAVAQEREAGLLRHVIARLGGCDDDEDQGEGGRDAPAGHAVTPAGGASQRLSRRRMLPRRTAAMSSSGRSSTACGCMVSGSTRSR